jgi:sugar lactone lactonase YvrE
MTVRAWIRKLFARTPRRTTQGSRQAPPRFRPNIDVLEDRLTPSSLGTTALVEGPAGGSDSDIVITSGAWSASSNAPSWLHTSSKGTGNGLATFTFDPNPKETRSGTLTIAGQTLTVTQAGSTYVSANPLTTLVSSGSAFSDPSGTTNPDGSQFSPQGVAVDGSGNVFIADGGNGVIEQWSNGGPSAASVAVSSGLIGPSGVAVDGSGNIFIADWSNSAIEEWNASTQTVSTPVSSGLKSPAGVAVDGAGNIYIADYVNNAVEEWNASTQTLSTLISGLWGASGVAVDASGNVYVADEYGEAIKEWNASTKTVSTLVSTGLDGPTGVAVDGSGNVYIADQYNNAVEEWHASTQTLSTLVSGLNLPLGVAVDSSGNVYIADTNNNAVEELPRAFVSTSAVSEGPAAGTAALLPVLPVTEPLSGLFAPSSDQGWLSVGDGANGVVPFSFTANADAPRMGHLTVLGQSITVTQQATPAFSLSAPTTTYGSATTTISGQLGTSAPFPTGSVTITLDGVQKTATLNSDGRFSASFDTHALAVSPGGYSIGFAYAGDSGYGSASASSTLTVTPATLTVTPGANQSKVYGAAVPALTYTASGFVNNDPTSILTGAVGATATATSPVGSYAITLGSLSAGSNYTVTLAANPPRFAITPATLTITPTAGQSKVYGAAVPVLTFSASGLVNNDPLSTITGALATTATAASPVGAYPITLGNLAAGSNYTVALAANPPTFAVTKATLIITANSTSKTYGQSLAFAGTEFTASGLVNGDTVSAVTLSSAGAAADAGVAGSPYAIAASTAVGSGLANYTITYFAGSLTVTPAALTITADNKSMTYAGSVPKLTYHCTGLVNGETSASFSGGLTTTATDSSGVGSYPITQGSLAATGNYTIATFNAGTLTVTPAALTVTAVSFSATAGAPFSGTVATFTTPDQIDGAAAFTAVITWGDGSTSSGLISGSNGSFTVCGSHTYAAAASYAVSVQITNPNTQSATAHDTATVASLGLGVTNSQAGGVGWGTKIGLTAAIGFWQNPNGQALINSFNGGPSATALGNWLAASFPNLYGASAGANSLAGKSNAQVAAYFQALFGQGGTAVPAQGTSWGQPSGLGGTQVQAEVLATALSVYATTSSLGGTAGVAYGFTVSAPGLGARSYSVGADGAAFGVANNSTLTVYGLLLAVNQLAVNGVLYGGNTTLQAQAAELFNALDQAGSIG